MMKCLSSLYCNWKVWLYMSLQSFDYSMYGYPAADQLLPTYEQRKRIRRE